MRSLRIQLNDVGFTHGRLYLFKNISFELEKNQHWQIVGENGSGKTTLLRIMAGLLMPSVGSITGYDQTQCFYIGHQIPYLDGMTVNEAFKGFSKLFGVAPKYAALEQVGLCERNDVMVSRLSQGQKRRFMLAVMLMTNRPIWLLDEPFAHLDDAASELLGELMLCHTKAGGLVVQTTHSLEGSNSRHIYLRVH